MPDTIRDGTGSGVLAKVDSNNKLHVYSKSGSLQHVVSEEAQQAFQVMGLATVGAATVPVLHLKNVSTDKNLAVTYLRHQVLDAAGGTAFPSANSYFSINLGQTYSSGGTSVTPTNVYAGSGITAEVTAYDGSGATLVLAGTASEIDRWYTKDDVE